MRYKPPKVKLLEHEQIFGRMAVSTIVLPGQDQAGDFPVRFQKTLSEIAWRQR
jgi:hypothetical protein